MDSRYLSKEPACGCCSEEEQCQLSATEMQLRCVCAPMRSRALDVAGLQVECQTSRPMFVGAGRW